MSHTKALSNTQNIRPAVSSSLEREPPAKAVTYSADIDPQDSGSASDSTIDDIDTVMNQYDFGYPLQRMPVIPTGPSYGFVSHEGMGHARDEDGDDDYSSEYSESECSTSSSVSYDIDFESIVDDLLSEDFPTLRNFIRVDASTPAAHDAFMIRPLPKHSHSSNEYDILMSLNTPEARLDPWNPVPHVLSVVNRPQSSLGLDGDVHGGYTFVCLEWLTKYDDPPFQTVANYIDFIRQTLEGLTFLHEHYVTCLNYSTTDSFMVDIGHRNTWLHSNVPRDSPSASLGPSFPQFESSSYPSTPTNPQCVGTGHHNASSHSTLQAFDRTRYPVRYYYMDFSKAKMFDRYDPAHKELYRIDVMHCGRVIGGLLSKIPSVAPKLKTLVNAMTTGTFGADDARKLFEALCQSLGASLFDQPVQTECQSG